MVHGHGLPARLLPALRVFYLRYHLYRLYFPLMALGRYLAAGGPAVETEPVVKFKPKVQLVEA
ncbi:MAG: hypothetical protein ACYSUA_15255 [Planctomycetota bacterium]